MSTTVSNLNCAIVCEVTARSTPSKLANLFPDIQYGAAYKILQFVFKLGGQPVVRDLMQKWYISNFEAYFGPSIGKTLISVTIGLLIGICEVILLPLDALKVKTQTSDQLQGRGIIEIFCTQGFSLCHGASWMIDRNAPGSFALLGGNAAAKMFTNISKMEQAVWSQDYIASCAGASASISVAQPPDVAKTHIHSQSLHSPESGICHYESCQE